MVVANKTDSFQKLQLETGRKETSLSLFSSRKFIYFETGWELLFDIIRSFWLTYFIRNKTERDYLCSVRLYHQLYVGGHFLFMLFVLVCA